MYTYGRILRHLGGPLALAAVLLVGPLAAKATPTDGLVISEILFDPAGNDNTTEWVEIYNRSGSAIDLAGYSLGWGQDAYDQGTYVFNTFLLAPGSTFVIGGPTSNAANGNPTYSQVHNFAPNLNNGTNNNFAGAVALFFGDISTTPGLIPVHAVIYGESTAGTSLLDEQGAAATVLFDTDGFSQGTSIEWLGGTSWGVSASLNPNTAPIPEPSTALLVGVGIALLALRRRADRSETRIA